MQQVSSLTFKQNGISQRKRRKSERGNLWRTSRRLEVRGEEKVKQEQMFCSGFR